LRHVDAIALTINLVVEPALSRSGKVDGRDSVLSDPVGIEVCACISIGANGLALIPVRINAHVDTRAKRISMLNARSEAIFIDEGCRHDGVDEGED
jgi:hypothetical protein